jgi:hypothetical protein
MSDCEAKLALAAEYKVRLSVYIAAVEELERIRNATGAEAEQEFLDEVDSKLSQCQQARAKLQRHTDEHGC